MKIFVCKNYDRMSEVAANFLASQVVIKPDSVLGLATGSTPVGTYKELVKKYKNDDLDFSNVTTFNLDEYVNLDRENINSYYSFMYENLFDHVNVPKENINVPDGNAKDLDMYVKEYENKISQYGGVDLQILGIGNNAHIGFNEPDEKFTKGTGVVKLTQSTIDANSRFFDSIEEVPKKAVSMGIGTIMGAKKIVLLASGESKADAINKMINGDIVPQVPASILQLHKDVVVILDRESAKFLDPSIYKTV